MTDQTITQLGLSFVYLAVTGLMAFLQRMEQSRTIRIWMFAFMGFTVDSVVSAARMAFDLPPLFRIIAWFALAGGALLAVVGILRFLGKAHAKIVYGLGGALGLLLGGGALAGVSVDILRPLFFSALGVVFLLGAVVTFRGGASEGAGRWVAGTAFIAAAAYALTWPAMRHSPLVARLEFYLDLIMLVWVANGVLMMHFDKSRQQMKALAAQELALRNKLAHAERLDSLGRLAAGVAHDFNNVLTIVINGTDLVQRQIEDRPKAAQQLKVVRAAAEGAKGFTRQLLALGRRRLPGLRPERLVDAVEQAMRIVRPSVSDKVEMRIEIPEQLTVNAAEGQLAQVLVNLAINALDAMPDGGRLHIAATSLDPGKARLTVADTGTGMAREVRERIFDPFFTTKESGGTGLGLASVYAVVQQLGGDITVSSESGKGTCFTIDLPTCDPPVESVAAPHGVVNPGDIRVLVVDDNVVVARTLTDGLRSIGYLADGSSKPTDALEAALDHPPDLLLSDVSMPEVTGPSLAKALRARHPDIRVILMSGVAPPPDRSTSGNCDLWLVKPVTIPSLDEAIQSLFSKQDNQV